MTVHNIRPHSTICVVEFVNHSYIIFFSSIVIRTGVAGKPLNCASWTKDLIVDFSNLAPIFSSFSSDSTCFLGVLFLSIMEYLAQILFKCLRTVFIFVRCAPGKFLLNLGRQSLLYLYIANTAYRNINCCGCYKLKCTCTCILTIIVTYNNYKQAMFLILGAWKLVLWNRN